MKEGTRPEPLDDSEAAEPTVVVDRDAVEPTIVVDREAEERTVVVEREPSVDRTVVVERIPEDGTVAVTRERPASAPASPAERPALPPGRRRRGMSMPPVPAGFGRGAVEAPGAGAVLEHPRREAPLPAPPIASTEGESATREAAPSMPSVARRTRRAALVGLGAAALAVVVSVGGLVALAVAVVGG